MQVDALQNHSRRNISRNRSSNSRSNSPSLPGMSGVHLGISFSRFLSRAVHPVCAPGGACQAGAVRTTAAAPHAPTERLSPAALGSYFHARPPLRRPSLQTAPPARNSAGQPAPGAPEEGTWACVGGA
eukprot:222429-Chlamydomonas_euryale.AAC.8